MPLTIVDSIEAVPSAEWNALENADNPFLRHEFLTAAEDEECAAGIAGWDASHLLLKDATGRLQGAVPLYLKHHSWGEFVFDFRWASAYARAGLEYYPKWVSAIPFTPATGPRLLVAKGEDRTVVQRTLATALVELARERGLSSAHVLFAREDENTALKSAGFLLRKDCQFHWHNAGFDCFDAFMATFRAEKRKKAQRERRRVTEGGVRFLTLPGEDIDPALWHTIFGFSAATFHAHGHEHYLTAAFFQRLSRQMPGTIVVKLAIHSEQPIAAAIFFSGGGRLYGRYWGALKNFDSLHFETCYYQGIDFCIEHGLTHFEPGTQGEHKVARGFVPTPTWSAHWLADSRFASAIGAHVSHEQKAVEQYMASVEEHLPFRRDTPDGTA